MLNLPQKVKLRCRWPIVEDADIGGYGECNGPPNGARCIRINPDAHAKDDPRSTLLHELIHACEFDYKLNLTEHQVRQLEKGLAAAMPQIAHLWAEPIQSTPIVIAGDFHCGSGRGLFPAYEGGPYTQAMVDAACDTVGGSWRPGHTAQVIWGEWLKFLAWIEQRAAGRKFDLVLNGDLMDGNKHDGDQFEKDPAIQSRIAHTALEPLCQMAGRVYITRGTEAHSGSRSHTEEMLAQRLGALQCPETKRFARTFVDERFGEKQWRVNVAHHPVGGGTMPHTRANAAQKLDMMGLVAHGERSFDPNHKEGPPPVLYVRSHSHVAVSVSKPINYPDNPEAERHSVACPPWQLKGDWVNSKAFQLDNAVVGGLIVEAGETLWVRKWARTLITNSEVAQWLMG